MCAKQHKAFSFRVKQKGEDDGNVVLRAHYEGFERQAEDFLLSILGINGTHWDFGARKWISYTLNLGICSWQGV